MHERAVDVREALDSRLQALANVVGVPQAGVARQTDVDLDECAGADLVRADGVDHEDVRVVVARDECDDVGEVAAGGLAEEVVDVLEGVHDPVADDEGGDDDASDGVDECESGEVGRDEDCGEGGGVGENVVVVVEGEGVHERGAGGEAAAVEVEGELDEEGERDEDLDGEGELDDVGVFREEGGEGLLEGEEGGGGHEAGHADDAEGLEACAADGVVVLVAVVLDAVRV
mmetsp:Transcript_3877/g.10099  ORF Transcript_3877/g.10099 Transcript_3877/m.10099 type:complete len:230 (-) Transcript_3877:640-1329(-)